MQPIAVVVVLVAVGLFAFVLLAYCLKRMGRDVFISQTLNIFSGKVSEPSRPFRHSAASRRNREDPDASPADE